MPKTPRLRETRVAVAFLVGLAAWLAAPTLRADSIFLKNGNVVKGRVLEEKGDEVVIQVGTGQMIISRRDIKKIVKKTDTPSPPETQPAPETPSPAEPKPETPPVQPPAPVGPEAKPAPAGEGARGSFETPKAPAKYTLNGNTFASDSKFESVVQSPAITLNVTDKPLTEIAEEISRQAGTRIAWDGPKDAELTLSAENAPLMAVLGEICLKTGQSLTPFQSPDGDFLQIRNPFFAAPVKAYAAKGPLLLAWYGMATRERYNFDDPQNPIKETKYYLQLFKDPRGHVDHVIPEGRGPIRDTPVTFTTASGAKVKVASDHDKNTFTSGAPDWEFKARSEISGDKAAIEVAAPVFVPTRLGKIVLPWSSGQKTRVESADISLDDVKTEAKKKFDHDSFKEVEFNELSAVVHLLHKEGRELKNPGDGVFDAHGAVLIGKDGSRLPGILKGVSGISSPWDGYRSRLVFRIEKPDFEADKVEIAWVAGFKTLDATFKVNDAPLR